MEQTMLEKLYGEFCQFSGEMGEFKRRTLERLEGLEQSFKQSSVERAARLCRAVSVASGIVALSGAVFGVLQKLLQAGSAV